MILDLLLVKRLCPIDFEKEFIIDTPHSTPMISQASEKLVKVLKRCWFTVNSDDCHLLLIVIVIGTKHLYLLTVPGGEERVASSSVFNNAKFSYLCLISDRDLYCYVSVSWLWEGVGVK